MIMKRDDYIFGSHHFWTHFWCGFIVGAVLGGWISWGLFDSRWIGFALTAVIALIIAFCCGRWGDPAWEWIIERLGWFV